MKQAFIYVIAVLAGVVALAMMGPSFDGGVSLAQDVKKMPETVVLAKEAAMGKVAFSHKSHSDGSYKTAAGGPIACIQCHHTAQPFSDLTKRSGFVTTWPKDRTTTLTAELFAKDPTTAGVAACRDCHVRAGITPKLLPAVPKIKYESSTNWIDLTNQPAFHRACTGCHMEIKAVNSNSKAPTPAQCTTCHKRAD